MKKVLCLSLALLTTSLTHPMLRRAHSYSSTMFSKQFLNPTNHLKKSKSLMLLDGQESKVDKPTISDEAVSTAIAQKIKKIFK